MRVLGMRAAVLGSAAIAVASLVVTLPAVKAYSHHPSPAYAAIEELQQILSRAPESVVGAHQRFARVLETRPVAARILPSPVMRESTELAAYWLGRGRATVWYFSDPARGDLELVDPLSRRVHGHYGWKFPREAFMSGVRPDILDLVEIDSPPGWFAQTGWHLTPETLNISERQGRAEGIAHIRNRPDAALLVLAGESTAAAGGKPARVSVRVGDRLVDEWEVAAGARFFRRTLLEPGALAAAGPFTRLIASYKGSDGRAAPVRLTQLMVASPQTVFHVKHAGWNEVEYSDQVQRRWQWTSGRAEIFVNAAGRDVALTLAGESPLRYFATAPRVTVSAGDHVLATAQPSSDFELNVKVPAAALAAADGMLTIETDQSFVPHERTGSPDRRTLGLRIFELRLQ